MSYIKDNASNFAHFVKGLGFTVYMAKSGGWGFITDDTGSRVISFSFTDVSGGTLHGNYGPPSQASGTGWRLEQMPCDLTTYDSIRQALYEHATHWCGSGWKYYCSVEQYLKLYGDSSEFTRI